MSRRRLTRTIPLFGLLGHLVLRAGDTFGVYFCVCDPDAYMTDGHQQDLTAGAEGAHVQEVLGKKKALKEEAGLRLTSINRETT